MTDVEMKLYAGDRHEILNEDRPRRSVRRSVSMDGEENMKINIIRGCGVHNLCLLLRCFIKPIAYEIIHVLTHNLNKQGNKMEAHLKY